ncbi:hypothetical protein TNIN_40691 [Trichonephila inaurata madagascariensis]|uniref:Uncharacterized protein n=1 Tax=Trichonephila inaurata madagascariensis TaxID=2747483 RepID=A0A8X6X330_9ARAC|nr:hypothetical protein TNIN_40691 [Trichonephila inaurata madagascariensis]
MLRLCVGYGKRISFAHAVTFYDLPHPDRFETTNSFANELEYGRPRLTLIQNNEMKVALILVNSPKKSRKLGIPRISLQRLIYQLHLKPYSSVKQCAIN